MSDISYVKNNPGPRTDPCATLESHIPIGEECLDPYCYPEVDTRATELQQEPWVFHYINVLLKSITITTAADDIHKYFFHCFSEKIRLDVSNESSARHRIHMKHQALFSSKVKVKN